MKEGRNWAFVLYEDSCNPQWLEYLKSLNVDTFAMYHDQDLNPDGNPKKPHYHVMLMFEGKKSEKQIKEIADVCGAAQGLVFYVNSSRGMARYLCHLDNPDKHQYDPKHVIRLGGTDYMTICSLESDKYKDIRDIIYFCDKYNIVNFNVLFRFCSYHQESWFRTLCNSGAYIVREYLKTKGCLEPNCDMVTSNDEFLFSCLIEEGYYNGK